MHWDEISITASGRRIDLLLVGEGKCLTGVYFTPARPPSLTGWARDPVALGEAAAQLRAYAAGELTRFDLPLEPCGTPFQRQVWEVLRRIPFGSTTSYGKLAAEIGRPGAGRAVGAAVGRNPIGVIIPCHRVVGADGSLGGFGGGLQAKVALLNHEGVTGLRAAPLKASRGAQ